MREYFKGWRRKLGMVTLGLARDHLAPNDKADRLPYALAAGSCPGSFNLSTASLNDAWLYHRSNHPFQRTLVMTAIPATLTVKLRGLCVFTSVLVAHSQFAQPASAVDDKLDTSTKQEKDKDADANIRKPKSGSDLLKDIREASAPILAEMAETHGYRLEPDQAVRRVAPPFPELRTTYYKVGHPSQSRAIRAPASAMTFLWDGKQLTNWGMTFGSGYSIAGVVDHALKIKSQDVEGPKQFLSKALDGDWVLRPNAPEDQVIQELQTILQKEFEMPVRLVFAKRVRTVYVARGEYEYTPVKTDDAEKKTESKPRPSVDNIEVYGKTLGAGGAGGGTGEFKEFLGWVGRWIEMPLIDEIEKPPTKEVSWTLNEKSPFTEIEHQEDHDPETVLKNVAAQTGLRFTKEYRAIRRLVVEPIE